MCFLRNYRQQKRDKENIKACQICMIRVAHCTSVKLQHRGPQLYYHVLINMSSLGRIALVLGDDYKPAMSRYRICHFEWQCFISDRIPWMIKIQVKFNEWNSILCQHMSWRLSSPDWWIDIRAHFYLWLDKFSAIERRCNMCNVFSHWLRG